MKKLLSILLLFVSINAQDVLITISGAEAKGIFIEVTEEHVVFQQSGASAPSKIPRTSVARVLLSNGEDAFSIGEGISDEFKEKHKEAIEKAKIKSSFHGNKISKIYHLGIVKHLPSDFNRKIFNSQDEAKNAGYGPCPACFDLRPKIPDYYFEKELTAGVNSAIRNNYEVLYEHPQLPRMQTRLHRLLNQWTETLKGYDYRILIIKNEDPNAYAVAGGNIYVTTGLIEMIEDDSELDFIIGHEIAHIERRHSLREFKEAKRRANIAAIAAVAVGFGVAATGGDANDAAIATQLTAIIGDYSNQFAAKGFSREMEQEADIFAQLQLNQMGLSKEKMIFALDKLATNSSKLKLPLKANAFSNHPGLNARINQIMNSSIISLDKPRNIYIMDKKVSTSDFDEKAIIKITANFLYKGPSSNKRDEDIITLIGDIANNDKTNSYQIDKLDFNVLKFSRSSSAAALIKSNIKGFAINAGSKMDFATTVNIKNDKSDEVFELFKSGQMVVNTKVSKVTIKPGEGVKKGWNSKPLEVWTSFK